MEEGTSHFRLSGGCRPRARSAHSRVPASSLAFSLCLAPITDTESAQGYFSQEALSDWALIPLLFSSDFPVWLRTLDVVSIVCPIPHPSPMPLDC